MSFQSIPREGWKSQKLLIKICHDCLLKKRTTPVLLPPRRYLSTPVITNKQKTNPFDIFRNELYQIPPKKHDSYSPQTTIARREFRKRLLKNYNWIKHQQPGLFSQLTQPDLDRLVSYFLSKNPDDPQSNGAFFHVYQIFEDWKAGQLFPQLSFRIKDLENMIYIATELGWVDVAEKLLREAVVDQRQQVSSASYEAVIRALAKHDNQLDRINFWLDHITTYTSDMVQSVVLCHLGRGDLEKAAQFLRHHHPGSDLTQLVSRHSLDNDRELLDQALTLFAMDSLRKWRLNDMRLIYARKRYFGMSTHVVIKHLVNKGLFTGQTHTVQKLLEDTLYMKDTASTQLVAKRLIEWYLARKNITYAVKVWETVEAHQVQLPFPLLETLVVQAAKSKYHVDAMRLYKYCKQQRYPAAATIHPETRVHVLRCLVHSKEFTLAHAMAHEVESLFNNHVKPSVGRLAVRTLFGLSAQTGDLRMFERVFAISERLQLNVTHEGLTSLIACYLSRNDLTSAKAAFQGMASHTKGPDVVDFNLLMRTVALEEKENIKDKIFEILKHMKLVNVQPDQTTLRTMISIYEQHKEDGIQKSLFDKLLVESTGGDQVFLNNMALTYLLDRTNVQTAADVFLKNDRGRLFPSEKNKPIHCNGLTFKILLDAATKHQRYGNIAEKLFKSMRSRGMKPSKEVYENLIEVIAKQGKVAKARRYIETMEEETGEKADKNTYFKLVNSLLKLNKPELAKEVIEQDLNNDIVDSDIRRKLKRVEKQLEK